MVLDIHNFCDNCSLSFFFDTHLAGLDHNKEMVYEHCKKLLESLMLLAANQDHPEAARLLLSYQTNLDDTLEMISEVKDTSPNETGSTP